MLRCPAPALAPDFQMPIPEAGFQEAGFQEAGFQEAGSPQA